MLSALNGSFRSRAISLLVESLLPGLALLLGALLAGQVGWLVRTGVGGEGSKLGVLVARLLDGLHAKLLLALVALSVLALDTAPCPVLRFPERSPAQVWTTGVTASSVTHLGLLVLLGRHVDGLFGMSLVMY